MLRTGAMALLCLLLLTARADARAPAEPISLATLHVKVSDLAPRERKRARGWTFRPGQGQKSGCVLDSHDWETRRLFVGLSDWLQGCPTLEAARAAYDAGDPGYACRPIRVARADAAKRCRGNGKELNLGWEVFLLVGPIVDVLASDGPRHGGLPVRTLRRRLAPRQAARLRAALPAPLA